jgi:hypothetical protein
MAKKEKLPATAAPNNSLMVYRGEGETPEFATARSILAPHFRHAIAASQIHTAQFGNMEGAPGYGDYADAIRAKGEAAAKGDLTFASRMLAAQAVTLDNIFTEMARRMAANMGEYLGATETYARIAMKAQAQSRAALETLAKLHQPREQTVRHVHVNEGGQAVITDQFHNHTGDQGNCENDKQSDTTGPAGTVAALPSPDPFGNGVPIPGSAGEAAMQDARRHESGRA